MLGINSEYINNILSQTAYIRTSCSAQEQKCAEYIKKHCADMGLSAKFEPFNVKMYKDINTSFSVGGKPVFCTAWGGSGTGRVVAPLYNLQGADDVSLAQAKGKIVLSYKGLGYSLYNKLCENGAVAIVTFNGNTRWDNFDIDTRRICFDMGDNPLIPCVNIHITDAVKLAGCDGEDAVINVEQTAYTGVSYNVLLDIPGKTSDTVVMTAHYDTTPLSVGAYDNMTGCIALLYMAEQFASVKNKRTLRLVWCGSEEVGLIGSQAYCRDHASELENTVLNINLDMLGAVMGTFTSFSCIDEQTAAFLKEFSQKHGYPSAVTYGIRSSDQNPFLYCGVPAVSFARYSVADTGLTHTRYDTAQCVSADTLLRDSAYIAKFTEYALNNCEFPASRQISDKIAEDVKEYMSKKEPLI